MKAVNEQLVSVGQVTISQSFGFSASHELRLLAADHKCRRNHGHNYTVTASALVRDDVPPDLSLLGDYLATSFDHRLLNDQLGFHPTSELLAIHCAEWFRDKIESETPIKLISMEVSETPSTAARYDGVTGEVTIAKTFTRRCGDVTLVLGADGLDEVGFVTDFAELTPFSAHLYTSTTDIDPAAVVYLANWFIDNVEPKIRGRLVSVTVDTGRDSGRWERGEAP